MHGHSLYRIKADDLANEKLDAKTLATRVQRYSDKPVSDGMTIDRDNNIYLGEWRPMPLALSRLRENTGDSLRTRICHGWIHLALDRRGNYMRLSIGCISQQRLMVGCQKQNHLII